jgi:hypothetical protein
MRLPLAVIPSTVCQLQQRVQAVKYVEKTTNLGTPADHIAAKPPLSISRCGSLKATGPYRCASC